MEILSAEERALELTATQRRMWTMHNMGYTPPSRRAYRVTGRGFSYAALEAAISQLVARHEVQRTTFRLIDGKPTQLIAPTGRSDFFLVDLSAYPPEEREREALRRATADTLRGFDLEHGPLIRISVYVLDEDTRIIQMNGHHITADHVATGILRAEIAVLYSAALHGESPRLPAVACQWSEYVEIERASEHSLERTASARFWEDELTGLPPLALLRRDRPDCSDLPDYTAARHAIVIDRGRVDALRAIAVSLELSVFKTFMAAFHAFLHRYTAKDDLGVGFVVAGRHDPRARSVVGCLLNTVVLRTQTPRNASFAEYARATGSRINAALKHSAYPYDEVATMLRHERLSARDPVVSVIVSYRTARIPMLAFEDMCVELVNDAPELTPYDLSLDVIEEANGLHLSFDYPVAFFDADTIERLVHHFSTFLDAVVTSPALPLEGHPLQSAAERNHVLTAWNQTHEERPAKTLAALFEEQSGRTPDAPAISDGSHSSTYASLNHRANRVARFLQRFGARHGVAIGICLPWSTDAVIAILAVLKTGAHYVPLDPNDPPQRLAAMVEDAAPAVIIMAGDASSMPSLNVPIVVLDEHAQTIAREEDTNLASGAGSNDLGYVMYTSGSTGTPKGVMLEHRSIVDRLLWLADYHDVRASDVFLGRTPLTFDPSVVELFLPLVCGARLVPCAPGRHHDPAYLASVIDSEHVTFAVFVPHVLEGLLEHATSARCASLRVLITIGDVLDPSVEHRVVERFGHILYNYYGPTEAAIFATVWHARGDERLRVPIGHPIGNTQAYIIDANGEPVPIGVEGDIVLGGSGIARGYLNLPERTAERFIPNSFNPDAGSLYKTGDRGRYLADGAIDFLGRADTQVKIYGVRIELGEIESTLCRHPEVLEAVAIVAKDAAAQELLAYVVLREGSAATAATLRDDLAVKLPRSMLPSVVTVLPALPRSSSGKTDRLALPAPSRVRPKPRVPTSDTERQLAAIWKTLLRVDGLGIDDDFFALGGSSLLLTRLNAAIEAHFGKRLSMATLFGATTIAAQANVLTGATPKTSGGKKLFFFHGNYGMRVWPQLTHAMQPDLDFVGLVPEPEMLSGFSTVGSLAERFTVMLRALQPVGPYRVGGYCIGGLVAYEVARRLRDAGEQVERVILVDTFAQPLFWSIPETLLRVAMRSGTISRASAKMWIERIRYRIGVWKYSPDRSIVRRLRYLASKIKRGTEMRNRAAFTGAKASDDSLDLQRAFYESYVPGEFLGNVTLFWSENPAYQQMAGQHSAYWQRRAPSLEVRRLVGDHATAFVDHAESNGKLLAQAFEDRH